MAPVIVDRAESDGGDWQAVMFDGEGSGDRKVSAECADTLSNFTND